MKRLCSLLLSAVMLAALTLPAFAAEEPYFPAVNTYTDGQFTDVPASSKWSANVRTVYEIGLMTGITDTRFDPDGTLTVAQALVMACRLHDGFCPSGPELPSSGGTSGVWYQPYVDYAEAHEMIDFEGFDEFNEPVNRNMFATMMYVATPFSAMEAVNSVEDGAIPDVPMSDYSAEAIYCLYRAGVLTGNDGKGTFTPLSTISRGAAAAIISRIADPSLRKSITLTKQPFQPVPMKSLNNLKSLQKKATDAQFAEAYNVALEIVTPLAELPIEEQLEGIAYILREMFDSGMEYSMDAPHYDDPYGYFVLGVASCAGCTRATGLCLNILGIPYEHVNEGQYSHQWCRINVNGVYWICDAYGLYCGPEPSPYHHPMESLF